jgi:hypothetical protein
MGDTSQMHRFTARRNAEAVLRAGVQDSGFILWQ